MKKENGKWGADDAKAFATKIENLEKEIADEETSDDGKIDWRVMRFGDVGSDSWNMHTQELNLELEKLKAQHAHETKSQELNRLKQLAGIAMPHVETLAIKQAKRQIKKL